MSYLADVLDMAANLHRHGPRPERRVRWCWCPTDDVQHPHQPGSGRFDCPPRCVAWSVRRDGAWPGRPWVIRHPDGEAIGRYTPTRPGWESAIARAQELAVRVR